MSESRWKYILQSVVRPKVLMWFSGILFCLMILMLPFILRAYRVNMLPDVGEPFDVAAHGTVEIADEDNVFVLYRQAVAIMHPSDDLVSIEGAYDNLESAREEGWHVANDDVRKWFDENREAMAIWLRGTEKPNAVEIQPGDYRIETYQAITMDLREFASLALLNASRLTESGHAGEAWKWYRATLRSSRHAGMHTDVNGRLTGAAIHTLAGKDVIRWASQSSVDTEMLRVALRDIEGIFELTPPSSETLKTEHIIMSSFPDEVASEEGRFFGIAMHALGEDELFKRLYQLVFANWLTFYDRPIRDRTPLAAGDLTLFELDRGMPLNLKLPPPADIEKWAKHMGIARTLVALYAESITTFDDAVTREQARQAGMLLAVAIQAFHREHGEFPKTLDLIVDDYLARLPVDPYSQGEPM